MVYLPWTMVERYMLKKWEDRENPAQPRPTKSDINIQWFVWLDWVPSNSTELDRFKQMFPWADRDLIKCRMVSEFKPIPTRSRTQPVEQPLAGEPE